MRRGSLRNYLYPAGILIFIGLAILISGNTSKNARANEPAPLCTPPVLSPFDSLLISFDTLMLRELDNTRTVGAAYGISYKGETVLQQCYGLKENGSSDSIDAETVFRLASVSKTLTGVLAGILNDRGEVKLGSRVSDFLPGFTLRDSLNTVDLRIEHLLNHTPGLVPHAYDNLVEAKVPYHTIYDSLFRVIISAPPGEVYGYQNFVFSLYDTICQVQFNKTYTEVVQQELFTPLGMKSASVGFEPFKSNPNKALPHAGRRTLRLNDRYYLTNPAAGVNASLQDMSALVNALTDPNHSILNRQIRDTIFTPRIYTPLKWYYLNKWDRVDSRHYGLGWRIIGYKGRTIAYHGGYVQGYRAEIAVCPEENIGFVYLSNSPSPVGSISVPTFLNMYFSFLEERAPLQADTCSLAIP